MNSEKAAGGSGGKRGSHKEQAQTGENTRGFVLQEQTVALQCPPRQDRGELRSIVLSRRERLKAGLLGQTNHFLVFIRLTGIHSVSHPVSETLLDPGGIL